MEALNHDDHQHVPHAPLATLTRAMVVAAMVAFVYAGSRY